MRALLSEAVGGPETLALREMAAPYLTPLESLGFDHTLMRLETEVAWHERLVKELPPSPADSAGTSLDPEERNDREEA